MTDIKLEVEYIKRHLSTANPEEMEKALKWAIRRLRLLKLPDATRNEIMNLTLGMVLMSTESTMYPVLLYGLGLINISQSREQPEQDLTATTTFHSAIASGARSKQGS